MKLQTKPTTTVTRADIVGLLKARPFRPFKLRMNNGRVFDVRESDDLWTGLSGSLIFDSGHNDFGLSDVESVVAVQIGRGSKRNKSSR